MSFVRRTWWKLLKVWWRVSVPVRLRCIGVEVRSGALFYGMPIVVMAKGSRIVIGERAVVCSDSRFTALGLNHSVVLRTLYDGAEICIGDDVGISGATIVAARKIEIGARCLIGANAQIVDSDFHSIDPANRRYGGTAKAAPVQIGADVFIGASASVLKGVVVADGSVIGAHSLVTRSILKPSVVGGVPATTLRHLR